MVGLSIAWMLSIDGLPIGPGVSPVCLRVLYGELDSRSAVVILLSFFL